MIKQKQHWRIVTINKSTRWLANSIAMQSIAVHERQWEDACNDKNCMNICAGHDNWNEGRDQIQSTSQAGFIPFGAQSGMNGWCAQRRHIPPPLRSVYLMDQPGSVISISTSITCSPHSLCWLDARQSWKLFHYFMYGMIWSPRCEQNSIVIIY